MSVVTAAPVLLGSYHVVGVGWSMGILIGLGAEVLVGLAEEILPREILLRLVEDWVET